MTDPLHTAQRAQLDLVLDDAGARHGRAYGAELDTTTGKARPQCIPAIDELGDPTDYERPSTGAIIATAALTSITAIMLGITIYATFTGWQGPQ